MRSKTSANAGRHARAALGVLVACLALLATPLTAGAAVSADLSVSQTASPDPVTVGLDVRFLVTVTNNGPGSATGIKLNDALPAGTTFVSMTPSQGSCLKKLTNITCSLGGLASGASATLSVLVTAPGSEGSITNSASASAKQPDSNLSNNSSAPTTTVQPFMPNQAAGFCPPGGCMITTDPGTGPTPATIESTTATIPAGGGGVVSLFQETGDPSDCPGYDCFGQRVLITTPPSAPGDPIRFVFRIDDSVVPPGKLLSQVRTFHDGVLVPLCLDTSGVANPDPCVFQKEFLTDGDLQITILSSTNGRWRS